MILNSNVFHLNYWSTSSALVYDRPALMTYRQQDKRADQTAGLGPARRPNGCALLGVCPRNHLEGRSGV